MGGYYNARRGPTIADLMMDRGRILAEGASRSGDIWSSGLSNAGQLFARSLADQREQKLQEARVQRENANAARLEAVAKRETDDRAAMDSAMSSAAGGGFDADAIEAQLPGHLRLQFRKSVGEANAAALKMREAQADYYGRLAAGVKPFLGGEDGGIGAVQLALKHAKAEGVSGTDELMAQIQKDPTSIPKIVDSLIMKSPTVSKEMREASKLTEVSPGATLVDPVTKKPIYTAPIRETRSLEEQRAEALATGDTAKATSLLKQIGESAAARRDPNVAAARADALVERKTARADARADRSYQFNSAELERTAKPLTDQAERFGRLVETVNQRTPQADALIAPELLTVMAGGSGSGLRMNEAEISRILGGRTAYEDLKAKLNKFSLDPSKGLSVTDAQRAQIQALIATMHTRITTKAAALQEARQALIDADTVEDQRKVMAKLKSTLADTGTSGDSGGPKRVTSKAEVDALAPGTHFIGPDGVERVR
jgi:hypothetical protein